VVDVVRWEPVAPTWLGHRPEPLIHERVRACPLTLEEGARAVRWAGIDAEGRVAALRDSYPDSPPSEPDYVERVEYEPNAIGVYYAETVLVRTELDEEGRPLRSVYPSQGLEERYRYDGVGRLIEITGVMAAVGAGWSRPLRGATKRHDEADRTPRQLASACPCTPFDLVSNPRARSCAREKLLIGAQDSRDLATSLARRWPRLATAPWSVRCRWLGSPRRSASLARSDRAHLDRKRRSNP
jgi:YD repeat-containing protein